MTLHREWKARVGQRREIDLTGRECRDHGWRTVEVNSFNRVGHVLVRGDTLWSKELEWRIGTSNDPPDAQLHRFCGGGRKSAQNGRHDQGAAA
jgi:hypothetical protein